MKTAVELCEENREDQLAVYRAAIRRYEVAIA
jgi:hypothetical protein